MRGSFVLAVVGISLAAPATAQAAYVELYRVRDVGARILHRVEWCVERGDVRAGYETFVKFHTRIERENGSDRRLTKGSNWYSRGCWTTRFSQRDNLRYEDWYYGRVRITINGYTLGTGWREFWSS